jgi:hypothetical protein
MATLLAFQQTASIACTSTKRVREKWSNKTMQDHLSQSTLNVVINITDFGTRAAITMLRIGVPVDMPFFAQKLLSPSLRVSFIVP